MRTEETIDKAINEAKRKLKEAIKEINDEEVKSLCKKDNPFFVRLFGDTSEMTRSQIKNITRPGETVTGLSQNYGF